ncbi:MAG: TlpA family protein disulfide reductase, partial [Duncaniella sp.]|nr:TlpA family protein disulfide reductase [Duncaniella sp.]
FKDFEVTYNDSTFRLSDYVGKGKYVLVDFWASWCGPCIRQTAVIKDLYKEYGPKGLEVIGVAVWDKPEDTLKGIESHELPWKNIINAQSIPTEIYGIQGIPCIILFGPDGKIISRDKQNDDLRNDVAKAMESAK